ncbi:hypothetical protein V6N11_024081 [Hibiscus sabdariffa]|uniref:Deoxyhypusine hydroxylase n=1 Tax=Hibiscus sabdariffa TaxID=183260 RepID=A0ABR2TQ08_9ROSI
MGSLDDGVSASGSSLPNSMEKFLCDRLLDPSQPISERFRALFSLRNLKGPGPRNALIQATRDSSNLLAHEAAFALGQMQDSEAIPALEAVLNDLSLHPIVRHEAAEALGAIGLESNIPLLKNSLVLDPAPEVRETCELALQRIEELNSGSRDDKSSMTEKSPFLSVDPAGAAPSHSSVDKLREVLLDETRGMYERYSALFALRNHGGEEAVSAIIDSLGAESALLKHEVAYVLGQLQNKAASAVLSNVLRNAGEHPMVRHEAAEALGSIADDQSVALLEEFARDPEPIVSQSCEVALSMLEFERAGKSFEFLFMQTPVVACLQAQLLQVKAQLAQHAMNSHNIDGQWEQNLSGLFHSIPNYPISPQSSLESVEVELNDADAMNMQEIHSLENFSFHGKRPCDSDLGELQAIALRMMRN